MPDLRWCRTTTRESNESILYAVMQSYISLRSQSGHVLNFYVKIALRSRKMPKIKYHRTTDILRVPQLWQFCRYVMAITTFSGFQKLGYVGDTKGFKPDPTATISCISLII